MSPFSCSRIHWLARPSPKVFVLSGGYAPPQMSPFLQPAVGNPWINTVSEANAKMEKFGINMCPDSTMTKIWL